MTHICVSKLTIIGSDNGLSPDRRQAIIWTNAGILLIGPLGTNFSEILIEINTFSFMKMQLKMSSGKQRPFCLGLNVLKKPLTNCQGTHYMYQLRHSKLSWFLAGWSDQVPYSLYIFTVFSTIFFVFEKLWKAYENIDYYLNGLALYLSEFMYVLFCMFLLIIHIFLLLLVLENVLYL